MTGVMGVNADPVPAGKELELLPYFANPAVSTLSQLTATSGWVELGHLPVRGNMITVRHEGRAASELANESGPALVWQAMVAGTHARLLVNGKPMPATQMTLTLGRTVSVVRVVVAPGMRVRVAA